MKKSILATLGGMVLGMVLMLGIFSILNMKPSNENVMAQNVVENTTEKITIEEETGTKTKSADENGRLPMGIILPTKDKEVTEKEEQDSKSNVTTVQVQLPYYIKVNRQANCVTVYTLDAQGNYTVPIKAMTCSVGTNGSTPLGVSKISDRYTWRLLFGNTYGHYSVRFNGHILFHSVPYMASSNNTLKDGQFNMLGQPASQGCIRLCVADAKWIYDNCAKGTVVEVYDSPDPGPLGKPSMPQVSPNSPYKGWDPTDPNPNNPWLYGAMALQGVKDITVNVGETVDLLADVTAADVDGLAVEVSVEGEVDYNKAGIYTVTYRAVGVLGNEVTATATVTILESASEIPESEEVETEVPETEVPETEASETEIPVIEAETEIPTEEPETELPAVEEPVTEIPSEEVPAAEEPTTEEPNTEIPDSESPSTEIEPQNTEITDM